MSAESGIAAISFGLAASLSWGTSDFSGGIAAKRAPIVIVMTLSYALGAVLLLALALVTREPFPAFADIAWGTIAGMCGAAGLTAQYRALAVGRMGMAAPVAAVLGAALPVGFAALNEGLPSPVQLSGFACGLIAVWLIARTADGDGGRAGLGLAVIAGLGFGVFFILLDRVSNDTVFWPLVTARTASLLVMIALSMNGKRAQSLPRATIAIILVAGVLDVGGNTFFLLATQAGRLDVASVVSSLYPAVTVVLARVLLSEQLTREQMVGVFTALAAVVLIAL